MAQLSDFTPQQAEMIIALPFKAGIWISHSDDVDGEMDDARERKALENCIRAVAKLHEDKPFTSEVARRTLESKNKWNDWAENCFQTPEEARQVMGFLMANASEAEQKNFHAFIIEIAATVARAAGEFGAFDEDEADKFSGLLKKITGGFGGADSAQHPMNVSAAEDSALGQLAQALKA